MTIKKTILKYKRKENFGLTEQKLRLNDFKFMKII